MVEFLKSRWYSERMRTESTLARWGHFGQPVLVFPTAGGDAEEIMRWQMIRALGPLITAGRIKIYSCDSIGGQAWFRRSGTTQHRMWIQNQFHQYVKHEVVPAIRMDSAGYTGPIWTAGASIGAFHAVAAVCRFPDLFSRALGMSGSYNLMRFIETDRMTEDFFVSSPLHFLKKLDGAHLATLRERFVLLASGAGRAENMGESWGMARALGEAGVPNRVDPWGPEWHHDWPTWRVMLPKYLEEWSRPGEGEIKAG